MSPAAFCSLEGICSGIFRLQPRGGRAEEGGGARSEAGSVLQPVRWWQSCKKISCSVKMHASLCILYKCVLQNSSCVWRGTHYFSEGFVAHSDSSAFNLLLKRPNVQNLTAPSFLRILPTPFATPGQLDICFHAFSVMSII